MHPNSEPSAYDDRPFILIWEVSRACQLACRHCRASAMPDRHPGELSTAEGKALLDAAAEMGVFVVVLTGGDPLERPDLYELVRHGVGRGLRMSTIPAATPNLTPAAVRRLRRAGVAQMALSLDAPCAAVHDSFRGVEGAFRQTLAAAEWARDIDLPLQINSVVCRHTWPTFVELGCLVRDLEPVFWEIFFLVPVGRGAELGSLRSEEYDDAFRVIHALAANAPFIVKVAEAPHYQRFCLERNGAGRRRAAAGGRAGPGERMGGIGRAASRPGAVGRAPAPVNAGKGFCFVSHTGEVYPSGFLPLSAGNVRQSALADLYRHSELFRALRDPGRLAGRCGTCSFRSVCGGSRSRAFAMTGDPFAEEPFCPYEPASRPL